LDWFEVAANAVGFLLGLEMGVHLAAAHNLATFSDAESFVGGFVGF